MNADNVVIEVQECFDCPFFKMSMFGFPTCKKKELVLPYKPLPRYYAGFRGAMWIPRTVERGRPNWCPLTPKSKFLECNSCNNKTSSL